MAGVSTPATILMLGGKRPRHSDRGYRRDRCRWRPIWRARRRAVLGLLPQGLPAFSIPLINYTDLAPVLIGAAGPGIVR